MSTPLRILIADDHPLLRQGLRALLAMQPDMEVVGEAADGAEAMARTLELRPDVLLLDLVMPGHSGLDTIASLRQKAPETRILVLTSFAEDEQVARVLGSGVLGYLLKEAPPQELLAAIRAVAAGKPALHPSVALKMMTQSGRQPRPSLEQILTEREIDVLALVARGRTNEEIAQCLGVSERTVGTHVSNLLQKLNLANRTQAALYALRVGLVSLDGSGG